MGEFDVPLATGTLFQVHAADLLPRDIIVVGSCVRVIDRILSPIRDGEDTFRRVTTTTGGTWQFAEGTAVMVLRIVQRNPDAAAL